MTDETPERISEEEPLQTKPRRRSWAVYALLGVLLLALVAMASGFSGYRSGIAMRTSAEQTQVAASLQEQMRLAELEYSEGELYRSRQRLEYIISINSSYPGAEALLSEIIFEQNSTATPTPAPTPTITPTPDPRPQSEASQDIFQEAQQLLSDSQWTEAIDTLLKLRKADPGYEMVKVDGMLFVALRNRGVDKILRQADLEGGIYDLALSEQFGPMDTEAQGFLNMASIYLTGASFWEINWGQAVNYFSQVQPHLPSLRDASLMTSTERYRIALIRYAEQLMDAEEYCAAREQLEIALTLGSDSEAEDALQEATRACDRGRRDEEREEERSQEEPTPIEPTEPPAPEEPTPYPSP